MFSTDDAMALVELLKDKNNYLMSSTMDVVYMVLIQPVNMNFLPVFYVYPVC